MQSTNMHFWPSFQGCSNFRGPAKIKTLNAGFKIPSRHLFSVQPFFLSREYVRVKKFSKLPSFRVCCSENSLLKVTMSQAPNYPSASAASSALHPSPRSCHDHNQVPNPAPRVYTAWFSGFASDNDVGYSVSARQTFGGVSRNVFVEGQVSGAWGQQPSIKIEKNQTRNDALQVV